MKKLFFIVFTAFFWAFSAPAGAATFTGGTITTFLPEGWEAVDSGKKDGSEVRLSSPDNAFRLSIAFHPSEGRSIDEWNSEICQRLGITRLTQSKVAGLYTTASSTDMIRAALAVSETRVLLVLESGNSMKLGADIIDILSSLKSTDLEEQKLFHTLKWLFVGVGVRQTK